MSSLHNLEFVHINIVSASFLNILLPLIMGLGALGLSETGDDWNSAPGLPYLCKVIRALFWLAHLL